VILLIGRVIFAQTTRPSEWKNPIVKKGYLHSPVCEATPFVFNDKLYRLETWQAYWDLPAPAPEGKNYQDDTVRVVDVETNKIVGVAFKQHAFATAFVWDGRVYVFASKWIDGPLPRSAYSIEMTSSSDLVHWSEPVTVIKTEKPERTFNTAVCRAGDHFVMLYESDDPKYVPFTFKYYTSTDLKNWTPVPNALYDPHKYVGGPALYYFADTFYTLYLEDLGGKWETRITRSKDLVHWQDAPKDRPFITFDPNHDHLPFQPPNVKECNASDVELCEWNGKTFIYFTGGIQQYAADLQWAEYEGTPQKLLEYFFEGVSWPK
jgi:alpha-L-fucosidase